MSNSLPETLFLRLSGNALHMARYDADNPTNFAYSAYRLNPQISLAANLREAGRTEELMQAPLRGMVQVLVDTPVTYVPLADFEEAAALVNKYMSVVAAQIDKFAHHNRTI